MLSICGLVINVHYKQKGEAKLRAAKKIRNRQTTQQLTSSNKRAVHHPLPTTPINTISQTMSENAADGGNVATTTTTTNTAQIPTSATILNPQFLSGVTNDSGTLPTLDDHTTGTDNGNFNITQHTSMITETSSSTYNSFAVSSAIDPKLLPPPYAFSITPANTT